MNDEKKKKLREREKALNYVYYMVFAVIAVVVVLYISFPWSSNFSKS
jgi:predicted nucleic acid-binding Zn ribbon protein